ncbi:hypothetical protein GQ44DRAFT_758681 [Phaeosphaeriaceae sp. PMI808]|nr:hypothetical protein GQ44DRAFT_758681 [Phaeosphaeriaceae sp. PMI808]
MSAQSLQITPPQSFTSSPLTPPATEEKTVTPISRILEVIGRRKAGRRLPTSEHWLRFPLNRDQYEDLHRQLREGDLWGYYEDKIRHDYFPLAELFVIRMPGTLHEFVGSIITREFIRQLDAIAHSSSLGAVFAENVEGGGSAEIKFKGNENENGPHQPDASFQHIEAQYPGVILEVSHSQKKQDLPRLADNYILGSNANIRVVIGIDVEYKGSRKASVSIWRPHIGVNNAGENELSVVQTVTNQLFRDDVGNFVLDSQASLKLRLEDFGTTAFATKFPDLTDSIHISAEQLFSFLERAEGLARRVKQGEGLSDESQIRKRHRDSTPPEELDPDREGRFVEDEERAAKKAMLDDSSLQG